MGIFFFIKSVALIEDLPLEGKTFSTPSEFYLEANKGFTQNAYNCWIAACIYVLTLLFSGHQFYLNSRSSLSVWFVSYLLVNCWFVSFFFFPWKRMWLDQLTLDNYSSRVRYSIFVLCVKRRWIRFKIYHYLVTFKCTPCLLLCWCKYACSLQSLDNLWYLNVAPQPSVLE